MYWPSTTRRSSKKEAGIPYINGNLMVEFSWIIYSLAQWLHTLLNKRSDFDDLWVYCSWISHERRYIDQVGSLKEIYYGFLHEYWWCSSSWVSNACLHWSLLSWRLARPWLLTLSCKFSSLYQCLLLYFALSPWLSTRTFR